MLIDVLSDRGFSVAHSAEERLVPVRRRPPLPLSPCRLPPALLLCTPLPPAVPSALFFGMGVVSCYPRSLVLP